MNVTVAVTTPTLGRVLLHHFSNNAVDNVVLDTTSEGKFGCGKAGTVAVTTTPWQVLASAPKASRIAGVLGCVCRGLWFAVSQAGKPVTGVVDDLPC